MFLTQLLPPFERESSQQDKIKRVESAPDRDGGIFGAAAAQYVTCVDNHEMKKWIPSIHDWSRNTSERGERKTDET